MVFFCVLNWLPLWYLQTLLETNIFKGSSHLIFQNSFRKIEDINTLFQNIFALAYIWREMVCTIIFWSKVGTMFGIIFHQLCKPQDYSTMCSVIQTIVPIQYTYNVCVSFSYRVTYFIIYLLKICLFFHMS